jgi:YD repeat-containing protein
MSYDVMGRAVSQSNPIEISGGWTATGADDVNQGGFGWIFTAQSYDWKSRPLVTTHANGTTKTASYGGCGCAGGEVVTVTDEGTLEAGILRHRQQRIYADALSRPVKTEILNWQGGSLYLTTTNTYNVRDQIVQVRQFDDLTGVYQETGMTYDGYGRLRTKHVPEQQFDANNPASTDHTTWNYNADDTVQKVTDARGAYSTLTYNNRQLVTSITYDVLAGVPTSGPSAVPSTSFVSFEYDNVGNRLAMTDGLGSASYIYDQLSRMTSETRVFNGVGAYSLSYDYNLAGELTSFTDPFGAQVGYHRNEVGKIAFVTGTGFGSVSTYASGFHYRASGQLREMTYGNGRVLSMKYDQQLQPSHYEVSGVLSLDYQYQPDGRLGSRMIS